MLKLEKNKYAWDKSSFLTSIWFALTCTYLYFDCFFFLFHRDNQISSRKLPPWLHNRQSNRRSQAKRRQRCSIESKNPWIDLHRINQSVSTERPTVSSGLFPLRYLMALSLFLLDLQLTWIWLCTKAWSFEFRCQSEISTRHEKFSQRKNSLTSLDYFSRSNRFSWFKGNTFW